MRTPRKVFDDHWDAVTAGDLDRVLADYAEDAVFVRPGRIARGRASVRTVFEELGADLAGFHFHQESITVDGPIVLLEWSGHGAGGDASGVDSFVIHDDRIHQQTLSYRVRRR